MDDKERVIGAAGGAVGLGTFAAALGACCSIPWVVPLLGVTAAVAFARLAFLLPYALVGAALLLAGAFWWAYRRPVECENGTCERASGGGMRLTVWIAALCVVCLSAFALMIQV